MTYEECVELGRKGRALEREAGIELGRLAHEFGLENDDSPQRLSLLARGIGTEYEHLKACREAYRLVILGGAS